MRTPTSYTPAVAWLLIGALASCSHRQQGTAAKAPAPADATQQAYQQAAQDQRALTDQQKRLEAAHQNVVKAQQQLAQAQQREEQERTRAQQLQQQASQHARDAAQRVQQAQAAAEQAQGLQTVAGHVEQATPSYLILATPDGRTMTFNLDPRTRVLVGTEQRSVSEIQQGADARVSYDPRAGQPRAVTVRVTPADRPGESPLPQLQR